MPWIQVYDPLGNPWLSTAAAALPIVLLLVTLGVLEWKAHWAALTGLVSALAVSTIVYGMPVSTATATAVYGAAYGLLPIGWIIVNAVFLYNLTVETGQFGIVKSSVANLSADRRIQALLIAFFVLFPVMFLSGTIVPVESMPAAMQALSAASPIRYYLEIALGTLLKGVGWSVLWPQLAVLGAMGVGLYAVSLLRLRRRFVQ